MYVLSVGEHQPFPFGIPRRHLFDGIEQSLLAIDAQHVRNVREHHENVAELRRDSLLVAACDRRFQLRRLFRELLFVIFGNGKTPSPLRHTLDDFLRAKERGEAGGNVVHRVGKGRLVLFRHLVLIPYRERAVRSRRLVVPKDVGVA